MTTNEKRLGIWLLIAILFFIFLYAIKPIILPFLVGIAVAYFLDPAADWLEKQRCSRTAAAGIIIGAFFAAIFVALVLIVPALAGQMIDFIKDVPGYFEQVRAAAFPYVHDLLRRFGIHEREAAAALTASSSPFLGFVPELFQKLLSSGAAFFNGVALLVITPLVAFYLLRDWDKIVLRMDILLPRKHAETIRQQCRAIDRTLAGYVRGQVHVCLILMLIYAIGLFLIGLKYSLVLSFLGGLLIIVPYLGTAAVGAAALVIAYVQFGDLAHMLAVLGVFVLVQLLESNLLTPKLVGDNVGLHPLWILFGVLAGGAIFGFAGVLLAVPTTAVLGVVIRFMIARYLDSGLYQP